MLQSTGRGEKQRGSDKLRITSGFTDTTATGTTPSSTTPSSTGTPSSTTPSRTHVPVGTNPGGTSTVTPSVLVDEETVTTCNSIGAVLSEATGTSEVLAQY